jgi:hypothetical protein
MSHGAPGSGVGAGVYTGDNKILQLTTKQFFTGIGVGKGVGFGVGFGLCNEKTCYYYARKIER